MLLPVLTWTGKRHKPQEECKHAISVLYESALQFALDMRRTRAVCRIIVPDELVDPVDESPNSIMQEISLGPRLSKGDTRIAFVLSGALVTKAAPL